MYTSFREKSSYIVVFHCIHLPLVDTTRANLLCTASDTSADDEVAVITDRDRTRSRSPSPDSSLSPKRSCTDAVGSKMEFRDIQCLAKTVRSTADVLPSIPAGRKDNVMFVTRLCLDEHTGRATYADDCGAWNSKSSTTTCTDYVFVDGRLMYVRLRDGKYCTGGRKGIWRPLSPQPQPTDVVKAHRHYATLQADENYRKRVTWFFNLCGGDKKAVVEYQGIHPGTSLPHGNAKQINRPFVRTHPDTLRRVDDKVKHRQPRDVYQSMVLQDSMNAPRDLQQV